MKKKRSRKEVKAILSKKDGGETCAQCGGRIPSLEPEYCSTCSQQTTFIIRFDD